MNNGKHWLKIHLTGTVSNADAFGSQILIYDDNSSWIHEVSGQGSHCSQHSTIAHFGLDTSTIVDSIIIKWPSGHTDTLNHVAADQTMYLVEGSFSPIQVQILSTIVSAPCSNANTTLYTNGTFNSYMWSTGDTTSKIIVTQSDSYYITATDHNGNITYDSISISLDNNDSLVILQNNVSCYGQSNGSATAQYQGNTSILHYSLSLIHISEPTRPY